MESVLQRLSFLFIFFSKHQVLMSKCTKKKCLGCTTFAWSIIKSYQQMWIFITFDAEDLPIMTINNKIVSKRKYTGHLESSSVLKLLKLDFSAHLPCMTAARLLCPLSCDWSSQAAQEAAWLSAPCFSLSWPFRIRHYPGAAVWLHKGTGCH